MRTRRTFSFVLLVLAGVFPPVVLFQLLASVVLWFRFLFLFFLFLFFVLFLLQVVASVCALVMLVKGNGAGPGLWCLHTCTGTGRNRLPPLQGSLQIEIPPPQKHSWQRVEAECGGRVGGRV